MFNRRRPVPLRLLGIVAVAILVYARPVRLAAHTIPNDVTIRTFVKPEGQRLRLLARVPLAALKVTTWPLKAPDVLDTERATEELSAAAVRSLSVRSTLVEGDRPLPAPQVVAVRATQ